MHLRHEKQMHYFITETISGRFHGISFQSEAVHTWAEVITFTGHVQRWHHFLDMPIANQMNWACAMSMCKGLLPIRLVHLTLYHPGCLDWLPIRLVLLTLYHPDCLDWLPIRLVHLTLYHPDCLDWLPID